MSEDEEEKEIREWIRNKLEKINIEQSWSINNKFDEFKKEEKEEKLERTLVDLHSENKLVKEDTKDRLKKYLKFLVIVLFVMNVSLIFLYFNQVESKPIILKIHEGQYKDPTIKLRGTLIFFVVRPEDANGIGFIESDGYIIQIYNLTSLNYTEGDLIETYSSIVRENTTALISQWDRKIGRSKVTPRIEVNINEVNKNPKKYEWTLSKVRNVFIENVSIVSTLPPIYNQGEIYVVKLKIEGLGIDAYYVGPKVNIEIPNYYDLLASVVRFDERHLLRIFSFY